MSITVFVVVTEDFFGGGNEVQVFTTRADAQQYVKQIGYKNDVECQILERVVNIPI